MCQRTRGEPLEDAERRALAELEPELRNHTLLAAEAFDLLGAVLTSVPERRLAETPLALRVVAAVLLVRLSNDLRSVVLLTNRGYALQAVSLVASIYEIAYTIALIGSDTALVREWVNHDDPTRPFQEISRMTRNALTKLGISDTQAWGRQYRVYRQLCLAKHANPLLQRQHGYQLVNTDVVTMNGPDTSPSAIRAGWFALEHAVGLACVAMRSFVGNHVPTDVCATLLATIENVDAKRATLNQLAQTRWGTEDPFPGRW